MRATMFYSLTLVIALLISPFMCFAENGLEQDVFLSSQNSGPLKEKEGDIKYLYYIKSPGGKKIKVQIDFAESAFIFLNGRSFTNGDRKNSGFVATLLPQGRLLVNSHSLEDAGSNKKSTKATIVLGNIVSRDGKRIISKLILKVKLKKGKNFFVNKKYTAARNNLIALEALKKKILSSKSGKPLSVRFGFIRSITNGSEKFVLQKINNAISHWHRVMAAEDVGIIKVDKKNFKPRYCLKGTKKTFKILRNERSALYNNFVSRGVALSKNYPKQKDVKQIVVAYNDSFCIIRGFDGGCDTHVVRKELVGADGYVKSIAVKSAKKEFGDRLVFGASGTPVFSSLGKFIGICSRYNEDEKNMAITLVTKGKISGIIEGGKNK